MKYRVQESKLVRENTLQSVIDFLIDSGLSDYNVNTLIHVNMPVLKDTNIVAAAAEDRWGEIWNAVQLYIDGDLW